MTRGSRVLLEDNPGGTRWKKKERDVGEKSEREDATVPHIRTSLPGPKAKAIIERDGKVVSLPHTRDSTGDRARRAVVSRTWTATCFDCTGPHCGDVHRPLHRTWCIAIIDQPAGSCTCRAPTSTTWCVPWRAAGDCADGRRTIALRQPSTEAVEAAPAGELTTRSATTSSPFWARSTAVPWIAVGHGQQGHTAKKASRRSPAISRAVPGRLRLPGRRMRVCRASEFLSRISGFVHLVAREVAAISSSRSRAKVGYLVAPDAFLQGLSDIAAVTAS